MNNCIFCKIAKKQIPSKIIYETDKIIVFLDINPASNGHALVISKEHFENVSDVSEDVLKDIIVATKKVGEIAKKELGSTGYNILNATGTDAQQSVYHLHFHVVPRYQKDELNLWFHGESSSTVNIEKIYEKYLNGFKSK